MRTRTFSYAMTMLVLTLLISMANLFNGTAHGMLLTPVVDVVPSEANIGQQVLVEAEITVDLCWGAYDVREMQASLTVPAKAELISGDNPTYIGDVNRGQSRTVDWTLAFSTVGTFNLYVTVSGYRADTGTYVEKSGYGTATIVDMPPEVSVLSPENITYPDSNVPLIFTINETYDWMGYSLDEQMNITVSGNTTMTGLVDGPHSVIVYANDTGSNMAASNLVHFTVLDTTAPTILMISPANTTYSTISVPLTFFVGETVSWMGYSLDGQANITISGNSTLTGLIEASHSVKVYANDTAGNMGACTEVYFAFKRAHDVAITNVETSKSACLPMPTVGQGYTISVYVTAENQGSFTETFNITAYIDLSIIGVQQTTLLSGEIETLNFQWNTTSFIKGNYTPNAYASPSANETDILDNSADASWDVLVTIPGDVDGDYEVTIFDIVRIATVYDTTFPNSNYDSNSDLNDNGLIDIFDIVAAAVNYEESWQP